MAQKLIRFIEIEEFKKVLSKEKDKKFKLAYVLAFGSGLRISEVVGLHENISPCCNYELKDTFFINDDTKIKTKKKECLKCGKFWNSIECKRSKSVWKIKPLTIEQVDLKAHTIRILGKGGKERITITSPWLNETNIKFLPLKINRRTLQDRFNKLCVKVLEKRLTFHTLRHGWANHLVNERNLPLPQLQALGGWSRLETVGIYTEANPKKAVEAAYESF